MKIKKGKTRSVLQFKKMGVVLKFPKILLKKSYKNFISYLKDGDLIKELSLPIYASEIKYPLLNGVAENWKEFITKGPRFQKTYFSFFGLINIQKYGEILPSEIDIWHILLAEIASGEEEKTLMKDIHHLSQRENFCIEAGLLKLCDYGGRKTEQVINELGENFLKKADTIITAKLTT